MGGNLSIEQNLLGVAVARSAASVPSLIGAGFVVQHILRSSPKQRNNRPFNRIMLGMSTLDLLYACVNICTSTVVPQDFSRFYVLANGTWPTCEAFGFLGQFASITSALYNGSLTIYYLLTIRQGRYSGWGQGKFGKIELLLHIIPFLVGITTAIVALLLDLYNPTPLGCSIVSLPLDCGIDKPCIRGENAPTMFIPLTSLWVWATFFLMLVAMSLIYAKIAETAAGTANTSLNSSYHQTIHSRSASINLDAPGASSSTPWSTTRQPRIVRRTVSNVSSDSTRSTSNLVFLKRQFATQALLYCVVFALTWLPGLLIRRLDLWVGFEPTFGLVYVNAIFLPLQGFWNAFVYLRPRYMMHRRRQQRERQEQQQQQQQQLQRVQAFVQALSVSSPDDDDEDGIDDNPPSVSTATSKMGVTEAVENIVDDETAASQE